MPIVSKGDAMRGLTVFISDLRNCKSKEAEEKRINKELANIRSKFKGDKTLDGYNKKKYVCKLLYMFLLGHDIDFGHIEAVNLTTSNKYTEKQMGYLFISVLVNSSSQLFKLVIQNIKSDLASSNNVHVNLALQCIANIGDSVDMAQALRTDVPNLLVSMLSSEPVKQSAALCFLRLFRACPTFVSHEEWGPKLIHLINEHHMGVVTAAASMIKELAEYKPEAYKGCVPLVVSRLSRIVTTSHGDLLDYTYFLVAAPWLCVKLLKILQCYPMPNDSGVKARLLECLDTLLNRCQEPAKSRKIQHFNAKNAIVFEAIHLIVHLECEHNLLVRACDQLGQFLHSRESNLHYIALDSMFRLAGCESALDSVKKHKATVLRALKHERDISVRLRAVDLLYAMCDKSNVNQIVWELLHYLQRADFSIREEVVLKVAILSERYASDYKWYVDTMLKLIRVAGDFVSDEVWSRVIHIVVNEEDVQSYAANTVFTNLQTPACHENMIKVGGFILGEFGNLIANADATKPKEQFNVLNSKFHLCSPPTKAILLSAYIKFYKQYPEMKMTIEEVFKDGNQLRNADVEIQQRTVEYLKLCSSASAEILSTVVKEMPPFPERESSIVAKLRKKRPSILDSYSKSNQSTSDDVKGSIPGLETIGKQFTKVFSSDSLEGPEAAGPTAPRPFHKIPPFPPGHAEDFLNKFLFKNNGILHEDDLVQVGVKCDFKEQSGGIILFFGNKTQDQLVDFTAVCQAGNRRTEDALKITIVQASPNYINGGDQVQLVVDVECTDVYQDPPLLVTSYRYLGTSISTSYKVPVLINKFFQPVEMSSTDFFTRWQQLGSSHKTCQKVFNAKSGFDVEQSRTKFVDFGVACLMDIDPNPDNLVGSGIIKTASSQIGCLIRLEPNRHLEKYRLTIRANNDELASILGDFLQPYF